MTDPRIRERRVRVQRQRGRRRLRFLVAALLLVALCAGAVAALHSPLFAARTVLVSGDQHTSKAQVIEVAGLEHDPPLIDLDTGKIEHRLEGLAWVAKASVHIGWPSTVTVELVERVPVATSRLAEGTWAIYDVTGRVLSDETARPSGLPIVQVGGVSVAPGAWLGAWARPMLETAAYLPVSLLPRIEEIANNPSVGVVLRLRSGITVIMGDDEALSQKFVSLATVLSRVDLADISKIDLRVAASPVLTPLSSASNVHGKGDG